MQQSFFVKIATVCLFSVGTFSIIAENFLFTKTSKNTRKTQIVTDISRYQEIRNHKWYDFNQIKHFPVEIPSNAKSIFMAYSPGLMSGSSFFQIRMQQPPETIKKLLLYYSNIAVYQYQGGDTNDHIRQTNGVPTTFYYTSKSDHETFPNTYKILVLKAKDQSQVGFKWNHGHSYGVAINDSASEIVYWVENW